MRRLVIPTLFVVLGAGCFLDRGGRAGSGMDGGPAPDAFAPPPDGAAADAPEPDASVPPGDASAPGECTHRGRARVVASLDGPELGGGTFAGSALEEGAIALPVQTFAPGLTLWRGHRGAQLDDAAPGYSDLDPGTAAYATLRERIDWESAGSPPNMGVAADDHSIGVVGELRLSEGTNRFLFTANDRGVIAVDGPGGPSSATARFDGGDVELAIAVPAGAAGFYPFRMAHEDAAGSSVLRLRRLDPSGVPREVGRDELRVDLADVPGRLAVGWNRQVPGSAAPDGARIYERVTREGFRDARPDELGITSADNFAVRWFGLLRFGSALGTIDVTAEKRFHLFVDGVYFGDGDGAGSYAAGLGPGWHDVVLELQQDGGNNGDIDLTYAGAPFELADQRAHTRTGGPSGGAGALMDTDVAAGAISTTAAMTPSLPPFATLFVEVSAIVRAAHPGRVRVSWNGSGLTGTAALRESARQVPGTDEWIFRRALDTDAGIAPWTISVSNDSPEPIRFVRAGVLAHVTGTRDAYPASGTWTSPMIALVDQYAIDRVSWTAEVPGGAAVRARVRAADTEIDLRSAPFVDLDAAGRPSATVSGRLAEVELTLEGDRSVTPRVWGLELSGRPCVGCGAVTRCPPWGAPGLQALYPLDAPAGTVVTDLSGIAPPLDLEVADGAAAVRRDGALIFRAATIAEGTGTAERLVRACQGSGELSVEAWVTPATRDLVAAGPARILTLSADQNDQGFVLGQEDGGAVVGRVQTSGGVVETRAADVLEVGRLTHLVFTRNGRGETALYVDGALAMAGSALGDFSPWLDTYRVAMGNERTRTDHTWLGGVHLAAIYARAMSAAEVAEHWSFGPDGGL